MFDVRKRILISEKEFSETNYKRLREALVYIKNNLINTGDGKYLTVDKFLTKRNNIITGLNNISLRKVK